MSETLAEKTCTPCRGGIPPLTRDEAGRFQTQAPNWELRDNAHRIQRTFRFRNFREALAFDHKAGSAVYEAGAPPGLSPTPPYSSTHNLGTCRMSENPRDGVCNKFGQTHDVRNLFISDGSQFTTGGAENPTLTIVSLAIRQAEYIADEMGDEEDLTSVPDDAARGLAVEILVLRAGKKALDPRALFGPRDTSER